MAYMIDSCSKRTSGEWKLAKKITAKENPFQKLKSSLQISLQFICTIFASHLFDIFNEQIREAISEFIPPNLLTEFYGSVMPEGALPLKLCLQMKIHKQAIRVTWIRVFSWMHSTKCFTSEATSVVQLSTTALATCSMVG